MRKNLTALLCALGAVAGLLALGGTSPSDAPTPTRVVEAADLSQFNPGNIITDEVFFAGSAMTTLEVENFIAVKGASCVAAPDGTPCLRDFRMDTTARAPDAYCAGYSANVGETAGAIVAAVARSCGVSPRVLLVLLQKEQGLLTASGTRLTATKYQKATGFACPDTAACDAAYFGFQNQVYAAARQYKLYAANPTRYTYRSGRTVNVLYNPNSACGSAPVTIANQATAGLYIYTPYQPNAAALGAGYGTGDSCSAYGNRNFWSYFTDWFGSTQYDAVAATLPKGTVDAVTSSYGQITVAGWVLDPDGPTQQVDVHVYVDGKPVIAATGNLYRADVATATPGAGPLHGYQTSFPYALGNHQVCVYAINIGAGRINPQLGCRTVDVTDAGAPVGSLDALTTTPNTIAVHGWAFDADTTSASLAVHVYVDGRFATAVAASTSRPDVGTTFGIGPDHGYATSLTAARGQHTVCTYGINVGLGVTNTQLGCSAVMVYAPADYDPVTSLDVVSAAGGTVSVGGWAFDPDIPGSAVALHIYVDGAFAGSTGTAAYRGDVGALYASAGMTSGYSWSGIVPAGNHTVCVFAINTGFGTGNPLVGCRPVQTIGGPAANPFGAIDGVSAGYGTIGLAGWALDVDAPTAPASVHAYVDGTFLAAFTADTSRSDVARAYPGTGTRHGFSWAGSVAPGRHTVCLYAINTGAGTGNPGLGCRTVDVADPALLSDPLGSLDMVAASGGTLAAAGWALDPDLGLSPAQVHLYLDNSFLAAVTAADWRGDIGALRPAAGSAHGFNWSGAVAPGVHQVCAFAINAQAGTGINPSIGCRSVTVS